MAGNNYRVTSQQYECIDPVFSFVQKIFDQEGAVQVEQDHPQDIGDVRQVEEPVLVRISRIVRIVWPKQIRKQEHNCPGNNVKKYFTPFLIDLNCIHRRKL